MINQQKRVRFCYLLQVILPLFCILSDRPLKGEESFVVGKGYILNIINDRNSSQTLHLIVSDGQVSEWLSILLS
jgi:hypothetical protein